jgi:hypothetical protein
MAGGSRQTVAFGFGTDVDHLRLALRIEMGEWTGRHEGHQL